VRVNVLTVVANESYERYVEKPQTEIQEAYGDEGVPPKPANARKRKVVKLRKQYVLKPEFKELWEKIKHKTRYAVRIDTERLVQETVVQLNGAEIKRPRITISKAQVGVDAVGAFEALQMSGAKTVMDLAGRYPLPNIVELMANLMEHTTPPVRLSRRTLSRFCISSVKRRTRRTLRSCGPMSAAKLNAAPATSAMPSASTTVL
jgi:type III restriction enzyme